MQILKIIVTSIGGVGKTALETAEKWSLRRGGRISKRELMANRRFAEYHRLEAAEAGNPAPVPQNVLASEGTLVFTRSQPAGEALAALREAQAQKKPWLQIDVDHEQAFQAARRVCDWIHANRIRTLFVAGALGKEISRKAGDILETVFHLDTIESEAGYQFQSSAAIISRLDKNKPRSIDQAVQLLLDSLSFKEKSRIARSRGTELAELFFYIGEFIRNELHWWEGNPELMAACLAKSRAEWSKATDASDVIIEQLIESLRKSHTLRVVTPPGGPKPA